MWLDVFQVLLVFFHVCSPCPLLSVEESPVEPAGNKMIWSKALPIMLVTWNSTHKADKPEATGTFVSTLVLLFMVVKATSSYTERKEVRARI